ncbi:MAG TPA: histidine kinase [Polyangiaceae bacterium]
MMLAESPRSGGKAAAGAIVAVTALAVVLTNPAHARSAPECVLASTGEMGVVLLAVGAGVAWTRGRGWKGAGTTAAAVASAIGAALLVSFALAAVERATGLALVWDPRDQPYDGAQIALVGVLFGLVAAAAWGLVVAYPAAIDEVGRRTVESERALFEAENARLRGCLEPHFLLNALHAVGGLLDEEPKLARRLLACLGDLYRDVLDASGDTRPLGVEVAWLQRYAEILEARHGGAIAFRWEIAPEVEAVEIPRMLLQPLVENAVKHGARATEGGPGEIAVRARRADESGTRVVICEVEDSGAGERRAGDARPGRGLALIRQRLALRYGTRASLDLAASPTRTVATVRLPERP